ncbi:MAG: hypothetical protein JNK25_06690 [Phycisphaerae bacterium]|nr:hypothetical protein [Phycisphaerae bacterium]
MPVSDWQFWAVTAMAVLAAAYIVRALIPPQYRPLRRRGKSTTLTIDGRSVGRKG